MSGATEEARTESGRAGVVGVVLGVLAVAALAGFLAGAILGEGRADASLGLTLAAVFVLLAAFVVALAWWQTRRRAARLGLGTARYMKVVRRPRHRRPLACRVQVVVSARKFGAPEVQAGPHRDRVSERPSRRSGR
ncbi:hypothetical protein ACFV10_09900 [Streptomyces cyaneofuscatus]|uniref:hypothetical protein n=1 Tax=Streptomyces cyaneofuscatus TaxID=66883 RepID=UPI00368E8491